jgi:hypothetical protein
MPMGFLVLSRDGLTIHMGGGGGLGACLESMNRSHYYEGVLDHAKKTMNTIGIINST